MIFKRLIFRFLLLWMSTTAVQALEVGSTAPGFALPSTTGDTIALDDHSGQVVYVDFWASWCGPCLISFPVMEQLQNAYGERGFTVIAINVDQRPEDAAAFLEQRELGFPVLLDAQGLTPAAFGVKGMPTSYLLDGHGTVLHIHEGFRRGDGKFLEGLINRSLKR